MMTRTTPRPHAEPRSGGASHRPVSPTSESPPRGGGAMHKLVGSAHEIASLFQTLEDVDESFEQLTGHFESLPSSMQDRIEEVADLLTDGGSELKLCSDGTFQLEASEDRMFLLLSIEPPRGLGRAVTGHDIIGALRDRGIKRGVDMRQIARAVTQAAGETVEDVTVVTGRPPKTGSEGKVAVYGRASVDSPLRRWVIGLPAALSGAEGEESEGFEQAGMRARCRGAGAADAPPHPPICLKGDQVIKRVPATPGEPGYDALGKVLPAPEVAEAAVELGPGLEWDGDVAIAQISGVLLATGHRLEVRNLLIVKEEVTSRTEPIKFDGDVHLMGNVGDGAEVEATGEILVFGAVGAAKLVSTGGGIILRRGVAGRHRATVEAAGDVIARCVEYASVRADGRIVLETGALHSRLVAGEGIEATSGQGRIAGGTVVVGRSLRVGELGSSSSPRTEVFVGLGRETLERLFAIDHRLNLLRDAAEQARRTIDQMVRLVGHAERLEGQAKASYMHLRKITLVADHEIDQLGAEREEMIEEQADGRQNYDVEVLRRVMAGVTFRVGNATLEVQTSRRGGKIRSDPRTARLSLAA